MVFAEDGDLWYLKPRFEMPKPHEVVTANLGGGAASSEMVARWVEAGHRLDCVDFVDPGFENPETLAWVEDVMRPWLEERGVPLHVLKPDVKLPHVTDRTGSIRAYYDVQGGFPRPLRTRSCSQKFKHWPLSKHRAEVYGDAPTVVLVGYDAEEAHRIQGGSEDRQNERFFYPLVDPWYLKRPAVRESCRERWGRVPPKSGCEFCPLGRKPHFLALLRRDRDTYLWIESLEERDPDFPNTTLLPHGPSLRQLRESIELSGELDVGLDREDPEMVGCDSRAGCFT